MSDFSCLCIHFLLDFSPSPEKNNFWYPKLPNYVDVAFKAARQANPEAQLFYNDYGQNQVTGKAEVVYDMVKSMKDRGIPIDGVGMQQVWVIRRWCCERCCERCC